MTPSSARRAKAPSLRESPSPRELSAHADRGSNRADRAIFKAGLAQTVQRLSPKNIIVYGAAPDDIFGTCIESGINVIPFESEISKAKRQVTV